MEQLSQLPISGRRKGEDQSVAQGGDEGSDCSVAGIAGIDSRHHHPLHKPETMGQPPPRPQGAAPGRSVRFVGSGQFGIDRF
jgi:hypothetical protein